MGKQAGFDGILKITASSVVVGEVRDCQLTLGLGEADASRRKGNGWRERIATLKEWGVSGQLVHEDNNTNIETIRNALLTRSVLLVEFLTKDEEGFSGNVFVTRFDLSQNLEDVQVEDFEFVGDRKAAFNEGQTS